MGGFSLFHSIGASLRRKKLQKRLHMAQSWTIARGEVLSWKTVAAEEDVASFETPEQLDARFYFTVNGEYFGGHFRSVGLSKSEIRAIGEGTPPVHVRYNPANPDENAVLTEDNAGNLPFRVRSG
jgi:hypothetical protein